MSGTKKILLVEDDNNLREIYGARLQAEGYEIVSAPDGENALAIAVKENPDLIISDIMMPKVSGFDMLDILRNAPETKDTKVIMMTALSQAEDKARADKLGADMYLVKSQVTLEDVTKAVHQILDDPSESVQEADSAAAQEMISSNKEESKQPQEEPQAQTPPAAEVLPAVPVEAPASVPTATPVEAPPVAAPVESSPPLTTQQPEQLPAEPPASPEVKVEQPNPTSPPAPVTDAGQTATPSATAIPVSIPGDDDQAGSNSTPVEPNLAQALEDEEKEVQEKIKAFEPPKQEDPPQTASVIAPDNQEEKPAPEEPSTPASDADKPQNPFDDRPVKKVITPINDPSKGPDINELIAREEAKEAAEASGTAQTNQIITPANTSASTDTDVQGPTDSKDDFGKISL